MPEESPAVQEGAFLVLGGCGFIGRHIVAQLAPTARVIYVVDKTPPQLAWLNEEQLDLFNSPNVVFISANLVQQNSCQRAFESVNDEIDYVINAAAETRSGQSDEVYKDGICKLTSNIIQQVNEKLGDRLKLFIHFSTGRFYNKDKEPHAETSPVDEWNPEAKYKHQAEQLVAKMVPNHIILRPAIVYGVGDKTGVTPRLVVGAVYKYLNETMKLPWTAEIQSNTVHVTDLVKAMLHLAGNGQIGQIYNIVDNGKTNHGHLTNLICDIFGIKHDYAGNTLSSLLKLDLKGVTEEINEKHSAPWASLCSENGVLNTPLTPFIHSDYLTKRHLALDGSKLRSTGYIMEHPEVSKQLLTEILKDYARNNLFPKSYV